MTKKIRFALACALLSLMPATLRAVDTVEGPVEPTWESLKANFKVPAWFQDAKFGIFIHWGLYAVPAHGSEWYVQHMYTTGPYLQWHTEHFGPLDKFGYKDFIPLFTAAKYDPDAWALLFKKAGAKYIVPVAEHHDGFAMWDSALTRYCAGKMGPKRDLIGDLAKAVRKQDLVFGLSNHRMEHFNFIRPPAGAKTDLNDPEWVDFYSVADRSDAAYQKFLTDWVARNKEIIDKYQPQILYFDNGVNGRDLDPQKLEVAAYLYNRSLEFGKESCINTKADAYLAGSIRDRERGRSVDLSTDVWQCDTSIAHNSWGYNNELQYRNAGEMIREMVDCVSKNGNYLLNIAPAADGTIPEGQQLRLLEIGEWLRVNGDAIYGTRPWNHYGEGPTPQSPANGNRGITDGMLKTYTAGDMRFTTKGDTLYAILFAWPGDETAVITSLAKGKAPEGDITVTLLGNDRKLQVTQDADGLQIKMPAPPIKPCDFAYTLKITGLKLK